MPQINVDTVIAAYVKLREQRAQLKKAYEDEDKILTDKMDKLNTWLLEQMQKTGSTQLGSPHGTAYRQTVYKGNCSDWPSFWNFLAQTGRFDMMEKRVSVKTIQEYYQESGEFPPGITVSPEIKAVVRKA